MQNRTAGGQADGPLRVAVVGAGNMGGKWLRLAAESLLTEVVAVVDVDQRRAREALAHVGLEGVRTWPTLSAKPGELDLVVNTTVPAAHHDVSRSAMALGAHVVSEKPAAQDLADGLRLAGAAQQQGTVLSVSQSRSLLRGVRALTSAVRDSGSVGTVQCSMAREARFGGFREQMAHPLLLDMAVHSFDAVRTITGADAVSVSCRESNPEWSWYAGAPEAVATFEMSNGSVFTYCGTWVSLGESTSWNGRWRVETSEGALFWDGESAPERVRGEDRAELGGDDDGREGIAAAFDEIVEAARGGSSPSGELVHNLGSLAMVEAAMMASRDQRRVLLAEVIDLAAMEAHRRETDPEVRASSREVAQRLMEPITERHA